MRIAKAQFKWKFYRLTVEFNIIVLLVAMSVIVFFIIHSPYTIPVIIANAGLLPLFCPWISGKNTGRQKHGLMSIAEKDKETIEQNES